MSTKIKTYSIADVEKRYSDIIAEYFVEGWVVNAQTMGGSQGEKAKIHLRSKDNTIIRNVRLERETEYAGRSYDKLVIYVEDYENNRDEYTEIYSNNLISGWTTIWNGDGTLVLKEEYFLIKSVWSYSSNKEAKLTDKDGFEFISKIREERHKTEQTRRKTMESSDIETLPKERFAIVLPFLQRQPRCKTKKVSDILSVKKFHYTTGISYHITTTNHKCYALAPRS